MFLTQKLQHHHQLKKNAKQKIHISSKQYLYVIGINQKDILKVTLTNIQYKT